MIKSRFCSLDVEVREGENGGNDISGVGAPFYRSDVPGTSYELWPGAEERIMPTAFDAIDQDVWASFNHDPNLVLGRVSAGTLDLMVQDEGLRYRVRASNKSFYRDLVESLRRGDVLGSSFSFEVVDEAWRESIDGGPDVRELRSVRLFELGPVTNPAYQASTSGLRDAAEREEVEESYESWRDEMRKKSVKDSFEKFHRIKAADYRTSFLRRLR